MGFVLQIAGILPAALFREDVGQLTIQIFTMRQHGIYFRHSRNLVLLSNRGLQDFNGLRSFDRGCALSKLIVRQSIQIVHQAINDITLDVFPNLGQLVCIHHLSCSIIYIDGSGANLLLLLLVLPLRFTDLSAKTARSPTLTADICHKVE